MIAMLALGLFGGAFWFIAYSDALRIKDVAVYGTEALDLNTVRVAAKEHLLGARFGIFPKSHALFYGPDELAEFLKNRFLRIESLAFSYDIGEKFLYIDVRERRSKGFWCASPEGDCALFGADGVLFEAIARPQGAGGLLVEDQNINVIALGEQAAPPEWIWFFKTFAEELAPDVWVRAYVIEPESFRAEYVRVQTGEGWDILLNVEPGAEQSYAHALKTLLKDEIRENVSRLEYVELRVPGRAYYKLR